jgi:F420H(2)-dependent quinone reductase
MPSLEAKPSREVRIDPALRLLGRREMPTSDRRLYGRWRISQRRPEPDRGHARQSDKNVKDALDRVTISLNVLDRIARIAMRILRSPFRSSRRARDAVIFVTLQHSSNVVTLRVTLEANIGRSVASWYVTGRFLEGTMAEAKLAPNLPDWIVEHANRYLARGGTDGHMYKTTVPHRGEITAPALLLTTVGRKSGDKFVLPLFYGTEGGSYFVVASKGGAPQEL